MARHPLYRMERPIDFTLCEGEQMAIVGPNGGGKTMLVNTIIGRYPLLMNEVHYDFGQSCGRMVYENIQYISFRDSYGDYDPHYYYQQRWNSQDADLSPIVRDVLPTDKLEDVLLKEFTIDTLLEKQLVMLYMRFYVLRIFLI